MKRFIVRVLLFFLIVAAIDFVVGQLGDYLQSHAKGGSTRALNDLVMNDSHDILIMGSSRALHHYDAPFLSDTLGLDVYNAGYDGNGIVLAYGLLEMMLERYQPKLILFDVEPAFDINVYKNDNNNKRYISRIKPYYKNHKVGEIIKDVSVLEWYKVHSGLLRYNSKFFTMAFDNFIKRSMPLSGYNPLIGIYNDNIEDSKSQIAKIDTFKLKYMEKLISMAKTNEIPLVVVASPKYGTKSSVGLLPVIDLCKMHNVRFFDFYADKTFMQHKEWFKDPMHLNHDGARIFTKDIAEEIKKIIETQR